MRPSFTNLELEKKGKPHGNGLARLGVGRPLSGQLSNGDHGVYMLDVDARPGQRERVESNVGHETPVLTRFRLIVRRPRMSSIVRAFLPPSWKSASGEYHGNLASRPIRERRQRMPEKKIILPLTNMLYLV